MQAYTAKRIKVKKLYPLPLLMIIGMVNANGASYMTMPTRINSGGGISSSSSYSMHYSLGQVADGSFSSVSYQILTKGLSFPDVDTDGILNDIDNCPSLSNISQLDTDVDLLGNACDLDDDNDGLSDLAEASFGTDPLLFDTDGDGFNDAVDPNPLIANADGDLAPYGALDGIINVADLFIAEQIVLGTITPTPEDIIHADVYPVGAPDGVINISDLILIRQLVIPKAP